MDLFQTFLGGVNNNQRGMPGGFARPPLKFERIFKALPMSFHLQKEDTRQVDSGNKILMPPSALDTLSRMNIQVTFPPQKIQVIFTKKMIVNFEIPCISVTILSMFKSFYNCEKSSPQIRML